jgi:hypothetical protein
MSDAVKKKKTMTPSQEIVSELERTNLSSGSRTPRIRTPRVKTPEASLPTVSSLQKSFSPSFSGSPPSLVSSAGEPYVLIPSTPLPIITPVTTTSATTPTPSFSPTPVTTSTTISPSQISPPQISLPQRIFIPSPRRTFGRSRVRGRGGYPSREEYQLKEKEKEQIRDEFGSPQEGWIDIGSGIKMSVTIESQIKFTKENRHVNI